MQRWARGAVLGSVVVALAAGLLAIGTAAGQPPNDSSPTARSTAGRPGSHGTSVAALQAELDRVPTNFTAWSALGLAYVEQARITADPTLYDKAAGAFARSL